MEEIVIVFITNVGIILASNGFWSYRIKKKEKNSSLVKMVKGISHTNIITLGQSYIDRGYITIDEYENINDCLYGPYKELGGNGAAERIINEVRKLPIK